MKYLPALAKTPLIIFAFFGLMNMAFLTIPVKAQNQEQSGARISDQGETFFALSVNDIEKMESWYTGLFNLTTINRIDVPDGSVTIRLLHRPGLMIELLKHNQAKARDDENASFNLHGLFKVGFTISNIDDLFKDIKSRNIETVTDIITDDITNSRFFILKDPEGNLIQLWQKK